MCSVICRSVGAAGGDAMITPARSLRAAGAVEANLWGPVFSFIKHGPADVSPFIDQTLNFACLSITHT